MEFTELMQFATFLVVFATYLKTTKIIVLKNDKIDVDKQIHQIKKI